MSVCPNAYIRNHTSRLQQLVCTCCQWSWIGPPLAVLLYTTSGFVDDVTFSYSGRNAAVSCTRFNTLLHGSGCILSWSTVKLKPDVSFMQLAPRRSAMQRCIISASLTIRIAEQSAIVTDLSSHVCLSARMYCGETADWIRMLFGVVSGVGLGRGALDFGGDRRRGRVSFWG